jgi:hypothetical protein
MAAPENRGNVPDRNLGPECPTRRFYAWGLNDAVAINSVCNKKMGACS